MIRKFKCIVTRTDEYEIEFDNDVINEEYMEDYRKNFYEFDTLEDHAEHLAQHMSRIGEGFIEGYGALQVNGKPPWGYRGNEYKGKFSKEELAININVISEDDDCEVEVEEIK